MAPRAGPQHAPALALARCKCSIDGPRPGARWPIQSHARRGQKPAARQTPVPSPRNLKSGLGQTGPNRRARWRPVSSARGGKLGPNCAEGCARVSASDRIASPLDGVNGARAVGRARKAQGVHPDGATVETAKRRCCAATERTCRVATGRVATVRADVGAHAMMAGAFRALKRGPFLIYASNGGRVPTRRS